jgi:RNA polymerase-binding transcription factor DksA
VRHRLLARLLEEQGLAVRRRIHDVRTSHPLEADEPAEPEDRSQTSVSREIDVCLIEREAETLGQIQEALRRLARGHDRICSRCGGEIGRARLRALPFTDVCRACKERGEAVTSEASWRGTPLISP